MECTGELTTVAAIFLAILNIISGLLSVGGNFVVLLAIWQTPSLRTISNCFIGSLAAADFSVGLVINPLWVSKSVLNIWENQHFLTTFTEFMSVQTLVATTYNLAAVSIDRFIAVTNVFRYVELMTKTRSTVAVVFIWVFSFLFAALRFWITDPLMLPYLWITVSVVCYTVPFSVIAYCYYHIFKTASIQCRQIAAVENSIDRSLHHISSEPITTARKNRKAAFTIGIIIGLYLLFALPSMVISAIQLITTNDCLKLRIIRIWFWGALISFSSSACNPWVYAARSNEYRQAFKHVFRHYIRLPKLNRKTNSSNVTAEFNTNTNAEN